MTAVAAALAPTWPVERLGTAMGVLARRLGARGVVVPDPPADLGQSRADSVDTPAAPRADDARAAGVARWLRAAAPAAGLTCAPVDVRPMALGDLARRGQATLLTLAPASAAPDGAPVFVVLLAGRGDQLAMLSVDEEIVWISRAALARQILGSGGSQAYDRDRERLQGFCDRLGVAPAARATVADVLGGRMNTRPMVGWSLAPALPGFAARLRASGVPGLMAKSAALRLMQYLLMIGAWALVGKGALSGRLEPGWLWAWSLMLLSMVATLVAAAWTSGKLAVVLGGLCRERLVEGISALSPDVVRSQGVGQLLGTVLETEALESLARAGGPQAFMAVIQLGAGAIVLGLGAGAWLLGTLFAWLLVTGALGLHYRRRVIAWADTRLAITHELVESMVGHRTIVAQGSGQHDNRNSADHATAYARRTEALDASAARLFTLVPRGWLLVGLCALMPGFVAGTAAPDTLAISLGGLLLVYWSLRQLAEVMPGLAAAALAWRRTRGLFAAATPAPAAPVIATSNDDAAAAGRALLVARDIGFHHRGRPEPVLRSCNFSIARGERVLLGGGSGSGKSTLSALLTGLRPPSTGVLMLGGFDHHSLGPVRWRERAGGVPQFHENHILCAPLIFNLAMGRGWPPGPADLREIETVCRELGLGPLLARMPAGLQQMVGDSGWQLSHGERSRVFVARSLLMDLDLRVLDESFAALDPETFEQVLDCVLRRTRTLIVVAHL